MSVRSAAPDGGSTVARRRPGRLPANGGESGSRRFGLPRPFSERQRTRTDPSGRLRMAEVTRSSLVGSTLVVRSVIGKTRAGATDMGAGLARPTPTRTWVLDLRPV